MRTLILSICFLTFACATEEKTVCDDYCDIRILATENDAEAKGCSIWDDDIDGFEDNCLNTCNTVLEYVVEDRYHRDAEDCLRCITKTIENPSYSSLSEVMDNPCYKECNTRGGQQFFFTFYVSPPKWDCNGDWRIYW